jgi:CCR4-NOT transcriptional regulation complex NOT5 subunit
MIETKRYRDRRANGKWQYFDFEGNELPVKAKKVVFHFTNPLVSSQLIEWLKDKEVEPRIGL